MLQQLQAISRNRQNDELTATVEPNACTHNVALLNKRVARTNATWMHTRMVAPVGFPSPQVARPVARLQHQ
jgi:hypothetical protein